MKYENKSDKTSLSLRIIFLKKKKTNVYFTQS
jgi:hypothetical protein